MAVIDRRLLATAERRRWERSERREVYGRFLAAIFLLGQAESDGDEARARARSDALAIAYSELELIAGFQVGAIAYAMLGLALEPGPPTDERAERLGELRVRFADGARREFGLKRRATRMFEMAGGECGLAVSAMRPFAPVIALHHAGLLPTRDSGAERQYRLLVRRWSWPEPSGGHSAKHELTAHSPSRSRTPMA